MRILGLSPFTHDTAAALIEDGAIRASVEEGKLSRAKSTRGLPASAIEFCLKQGATTWNELDHVVVAGSALRRGKKGSAAAADLGRLAGELGRQQLLKLQKGNCIVRKEFVRQQGEEQRIER